MLVRDLISHMFCNQVASIYIYEFCQDDVEEEAVISYVYKKDTLGRLNNLNIPEDILNREVAYYSMRHNIITSKLISNKYEQLPYIELILEFSIKLKEVKK